MRHIFGRFGAVNFALVIALGALLAPPAHAQQASGIAGVVRDSTGLAIPGVTVEASSPALIEKVRVVTTDGEGRYSIVDLRVGTYVVTFSLAGFSTVKREGVELGSGFTATVNVTLNVGALAETITVSGESPVVDTQSSRKQETLNTRELQALPSGNIGLQTLAYVTPGFAASQADVGGTRDTWSAQGAYTFFHGKTGTRASFDGFRNQYFIGAASGVGYITDQGTIEELQLETTGMSAESGSGSTSLNAIPRSGSNSFRGGIDAFYSNSQMQSANIDSALRAFGIDSSSQVQRIYRDGAQFGGPIKRDRVWFFAAIARWGSTVNQPGAYYNPLQGKSTVPGTATLFYPGQPGTPYANMAPDTSRPAASFDWFRNHSLRTTVQASERQRVNVYFDIQKSCRCTTGPFTGANAIESERGWDWWPSGVVQGTWTMPVTSRLLLEAGASWQVANWINFVEEGVTRDDRSILELSTSYRYGAAAVLTAPVARTGRSAERFSLSYVTGTHVIKVGVTDEQAFNDESRSRNNPDGLNYDFLNGKPSRIQYQAEPFLQQERQNIELGIFAQDAWKIQRLTLNLGLRFDYLSMGYPAADLAAGLYVPARHVDALSGVPDWKDINPRLGVTMDVFGNGRTALKASFGRYNQLSRSDLTRRFHPFSSSINTAFRNWNDDFYPVGDPRRGNFIPDCDLKNFGTNGECGPISNVNFGKFIPTSTLFDDSVTKANRDYLWDINVELQHELVQGLSVSAGYNRNWDGSFTVTENTLVGPQNFDEFCITAPKDSRLPSGGGNQLCGFYDIQPQYFGLGTLRVTNAKEFGSPQRYWDGFTFAANGRLPRGVRLGGGVDLGRQVDDHCFTVDVPNQPNDIGNTPMLGGPFCRIVTSWGDTLDVRFRGSVPLKGGIDASFIYRNTPGAEESAFLTVTSADVTFKNPARKTLTSAKTVNLYAPNSVFGDRFSQLDVAVNKTFNLGWGRLRTALDVYNVLNSNSIQSVATAFGPRWLRPTAFLDPRLARVTASIQF
ncbi:MAG: carboxypeptidase regulatory-like domain-containing protein [Acidobacteria bacterium]|nr:carboxypeptidase regulatory-like domain-containing protein [Acidobacteriota bacterium]